jgi:hypothetical protein
MDRIRKDEATEIVGRAIFGDAWMDEITTDEWAAVIHPALNHEVSLSQRVLAQSHTWPIAVVDELDALGLESLPHEMHR